MTSVRPSLANNATREQINAYYRSYRKRNLSKLRAYHRDWIRTYRARKRQEALKTFAS